MNVLFMNYLVITPMTCRQSQHEKIFTKRHQFFLVTADIFFCLPDMSSVSYVVSPIFLIFPSYFP
jgi:hypothetical protein